MLSLTCLGAESYDAREFGSRSTARLVRTNPAVYGPLISHLAASSPCPETRRRCARLCGPYNVWLADTYTPPSAKWCCCDWGLAASGVMADDWRYWFAQVPCEVGDCAHPGWTRYRLASEAYVRDRIRTGHWSYERADAAVKAGWRCEMERFMRDYPGQVAAVEPWSR